MNKIKELLDDKKKRAIAIVVAVSVVVIGGAGVYALSHSSKEILKGKEEITIEYGESISTEVENYIITTDLSKEDKALILKNAKVMVDAENETDKDYPAIGEYKVTITYEVSKVETKVIVKDTIEPVFNEINEIEFIQGTEFNYGEYIKATDLHAVTYEFITETVDVNTVGEYTVQAIATDKSSNEAKKDIKVIVLEKPTEEVDVQIVTDPVTGKVTTKTTDKKTTTNNNNSTGTTGGSTDGSTGGLTDGSTGGSTGGNTGGSSGGSTGGSNTTTPTPTFVLPTSTETMKYFATQAEMNDYISTIDLDVWGYFAGNFVDFKTNTTYYRVTLW